MNEVKDMGVNAVVESKYDSVKVFSATMRHEREALGERVSEWMAETNCEVISTVVTQSSDSEFHCLSITLFYNARARKAA